MSLFSYFVLLSLLFSLMIAVFLTIKLRKRLTNMHGMIISMVMGMNIGLTSGVLLGALYQGDLYYSTILSMAIGSLAGLVCGSCLGLLPTLEGFMSGLMGGMMGAMLGEMITQEQAVTMINILLTLTISSLLLFPILPNSNENEIANKRWFIKPFLTFVALSSFLLLGSQLDKQLTFSKLGSSNSESQSKHENHGKSKEHNFQNIKINVHPLSFSYSPSKIIVKKDNPVTLTLINHDSLEHDLEIKNINVQIDSKDQHSNHSHGDVDFHLHVKGENQAELTFTPLEKGVYKFYCTIPGHTENGMIGELEVK
ncbi:cupredoxin domain-containing protein [Cytobacillus suaedae]|nr:cupredoxin domain-containing protein [Cytobacillus suaedae]